MSMTNPPTPDELTALMHIPPTPDELTDLAASLITLGSDGAVTDPAAVRAQIQQRAGVSHQRASSAIARAARRARGYNSGSAERQARRSAILDAIARQARFDSWSAYETSVINRGAID